MPPPASEATLTHWFVTLDGAEVAGLMDAIRSVEVDQNLFLPDMCTIVLNNGMKWSEDARIGLGHTIAAVAHSGPGPNSPASEIFSGDIISIEGDFQESGHTYLVIRAYDRSHRMQHGSHIRSWKSISDSDIASRIGSAHGLSVQSDATDTIFEHIIQDNVSDFAFLQQRAQSSGRIMAVVGNVLHFKRFERFSSTAVALDLGRNLLEFKPRMSASGQVGTIESKGWDVKEKRVIIGRAETAASMAQKSEWAKPGVEQYRSAAGVEKPTLHITDAAFEDQGHARSHSESRLAGFWARDFRAEGMAMGDPRIRAGGRVSIENQGKFNGEYIVTGARHIYEGGHYLVRFTITGFGAETTADLVAAPDAAFSNTLTGRIRHGLAIALVTQNKDPDNLGRVKVKFPWLDDTVESTWARWVSPMAGPGRGFFCLPEVNDEVVLAFENGDFNRPFILGALWNGQDKPPEQTSAAVNSSGVNIRVLKTRAGHIIRLDDSSGKEKIEIIDKTGQNSIVIDSTSNKITVTSAGEIELGASMKVTIKAPQIQIDGQQVAISGSAQTTIKGGVVQIN